MEYTDPNQIIQHLDNLLANGIDNIRIDFGELNEPSTQKIIEQYYTSNKNVVIKRYTDKTLAPEVNTTSEIEQKYSELGFLLDPSLDNYTKFVPDIKTVLSER